MYTFKPITDPGSMSLLRAAGLLWWSSEGSPTYKLLSANNFDFKAWWDQQVSGGMTISEDGKLCWPKGWWQQYAIREEQ